MPISSRTARRNFMTNRFGQIASGGLQKRPQPCGKVEAIMPCRVHARPCTFVPPQHPKQAVMAFAREQIKGSIPALITPMKDGKVDEAAVRKLVIWQIVQGSHGLVPCGTTGESPTLTHDKHKRVVEI